MAGKFFVALIDKQALLVQRFWVYAILSHIDFKQMASFRFQFNLSVAIAFAQYGQRFSMGIKVIQIQEAIGDISKLQSQAQIRPHSEGFQISRIRPRSIFRRMGLRNGDIITAVGGRAITSANDTVDIWRDLTAGRETSLEIKRRGRRQIIDYHIR